MANVKLSQITSGGAINTGTDTAVVVRSGTTDLLVTLGALASVTPATGIATFLTTPSSANLAAAITDETGTGALVFATSPTFVTPALGTPASGVATNLTGTASGLTAGNVTTNANLTGPITSVGNATTITANAVTTSTINTSAITYAKIQNESASTLLGNPTGSGAAPSEITLGSGLSFSGSVLNASGGTFAPLPQTVVSATSASAAVNNGYIANNAALCTITLPISATVGQLVQVSGQGAGGWAVAQNSGQSIIFNTNTTTVGVGGSLSSTQINDNILLMCTVANTTWLVVSSQGNINGV